MDATAFLHATVYSEELRMQTHLTVFLPCDCAGFRPDREKTVYLLHGLTDANDSWPLFTSVFRYAREHCLALVIPEAHRSFYTDTAYGENDYTYLSQELPQLVKKLFRLPEGRERTGIAGLSMGGYGAMKIAFRNPERYFACAAFSPVVDVKCFAVDRPQSFSASEMRAVFGADGQPGEKDDLFRLSKACSGTGPELFFTCGLQDALYPQSAAFHEHLDRIGYRHVFRGWPGDHAWEFWDRSVREAIEELFCREDLS